MPHSLRIWPGTPTPQSTPSRPERAGSEAPPAPAGRAPRQRGPLSKLKARLLPKSSETEISTMLGGRKYAGKPVNTVAAYTPPASSTASTLQPATASERARAARSQASTAALVQRTQQGMQQLRCTDKSHAAASTEPGARQPVTVPERAEQYRQLLAQRFAATRDAGAVERLSARLETLAPPLAEAAGEPHRYARPMLVAEALARTCGHDASAALRVLASLENETRLDTEAFDTPAHTAHAPASPARSSSASDTFFDAMSWQEEPDAPDGSPPQSPSARSSAPSQDFFDAFSTRTEWNASEDAGAAWRTAQLLSRYHAGFEALCDLMRLPQTPAHRHAAHAFLQAADALQRGAAGPAASPQALLQHCPPGSGAPEDSLAIKTLHAAAAQLRGDALAPEQTGALFAWRQGFREEGPGSDLAKVKARTAKFVNRTIRRVENHGWRSTLWQAVGKKKSPLSAARLGMQAAHRASLTKEYTAYAASLRTAVETLGAHYREALAQPPAQSALPWRRAEQMWQGAILQHWASLPAHAPLSAYTLTHDTLRTIGEQLRRTVLRVREELTIGVAQSAEAGDTPDPRLLNKLKNLVELSGQANLNLGADNLPVVPPAQFIDVYPSGAVLRTWSEAVDAGAASEPLRNVLDTAERIEQQDDLRLREEAIDAARTVIESLITAIEGGGKLRLASGATLGLTTGTISTGLQRAGQALAIPVAVQADFHASRKRQAVVEVARGSHGRDLFIGTDKTVHAAAGFGASVGYDFKILKNRIRALVGASVVPIDVEKGERVGVMYRAVRQVTQAAGPYADWDTVKYDDTTTREAMTALSNWLFQQATEHRERPPGADDVWNALAQHSSGGDFISVGWVDQRKHRLRHKVRVNAGVNARVTVPATPVRVGVGARLTGEITSRDTTAMRETTGIMRAEQYSQGYGGHMTFRAGVNYAVGKRFYTSPAQDSATAGPTASTPSGERHGITQGFNGGTPLTYSKQFAEHSHTAKLKTVHLDGRLADRVCYFDKEYKSAKEYLALIRSSQDAWIDMLSRKPGGTVEKARKEFEEYCATVEQHTGPHIRYLLRERLRPAAARQVESHLDLANLHRATDVEAPPGEPDAPAMPDTGITAAPMPPVRKTSHLPKPLRSLTDKLTASSQRAEAKRMDIDAIRARLASGQPEPGRMIRALQREAARRQQQTAVPPPSAEALRLAARAQARVQAEADAQACEAKADAVLFAEASWLPEKLAIIETVSKRESKGVSLTVQMQSTREASGQRELHNLKFS
ncbi:hypothetical protein JK151_23385 (plasmid) [Ralstonia syzygii subsp. celebesensis]|uniref:hypothetical protein n=1 Tax=Ralstonia syzygii TaxID=28097 RepID=UPI001920263E|nr:hypothetical protein [Ralstonia syzygii]QQV58268.1 hypothetical protein JK151_23385 [Ralstonia syzygii subsp. celebesensis]